MRSDRLLFSQALAILDVMAPTKNGAGLGANELLEKGRLLGASSRLYDEAFAAFSEGKRLCREVTGLNYLEEQAQQLTAACPGFFTESRLAILPRARPRDDTAQPIFILGFPRSGTTLVEQRLWRIRASVPATNCPSSMRLPMRWCGC